MGPRTSDENNGALLRPAVFELERRRPAWEGSASCLSTTPRSTTPRSRLTKWPTGSCKMAESGYTVQELESILVEEVAPAVYPAIYDIWRPEIIPLDTLECLILQPRDARYWLSRILLMRPALWIVWPEWRKWKAKHEKGIASMGLP